MKLAALCGLTSLAMVLNVPPTLAAPAEVGDLLAYVPSEAVSVVVIRLADLQRTELFASVREELVNDSDFDEFSAATGIDPTRDLDTIVCANLHDQAGPRGACIVAGRVSLAQLEAKVRALVEVPAISALKTARGHAYWRIDANREDGDRHAAVAQLADGVAAFGDEASVLHILDGQRGLAGTDLGELLGQGNGQFFGATDLQVLRETFASEVSDDSLPVALRQIRHVAFDARVGSDIAFEVRIRVDSDDDAELVRQSLLGFIAAGKLAAKDKPELMAMLAELQVLRAGRDVNLSGLVPDDFIGQLKARIKAHHGGCEPDDAACSSTSRARRHH